MLEAVVEWVLDIVNQQRFSMCIMQVSHSGRTVIFPCFLPVTGRQDEPIKRRLCWKLYRVMLAKNNNGCEL